MHMIQYETRFSGCRHFFAGEFNQECVTYDVVLTSSWDDPLDYHHVVPWTWHNMGIYSIFRHSLWWSTHLSIVPLHSFDRGTWWNFPCTVWFSVAFSHQGIVVDDSVGESVNAIPEGRTRLSGVGFSAAQDITCGDGVSHWAQRLGKPFEGVPR